MELFNLAETKSPRLLWMERHGIRTYRNEYMSRPWMAIHDETNQHERGDTEGDALVALAVKLGVGDWRVKP